jgi:hypothetical protein
VLSHNTTALFFFRVIREFRDFDDRGMFKGFLVFWGRPLFRTSTAKPVRIEQTGRMGPDSVRRCQSTSKGAAHDFRRAFVLLHKQSVLGLTHVKSSAVFLALAPFDPLDSRYPNSGCSFKTSQ